MTDVRSKVSEWLAKQGFPLEFKAAEIYAKQGFDTDQGSYITDPKEGKLREIDVIASSVHHVDDRSYRFSTLPSANGHKNSLGLFLPRAARGLR